MLKLLCRFLCFLSLSLAVTFILEASELRSCEKFDIVIKIFNGYNIQVDSDQVCIIISTEPHGVKMLINLQVSFLLNILDVSS